MRSAKPVLATTFMLAALAADTQASLDGYPSATRYLSNDAPFVVFGVTPTRLDEASDHVKLTFIATDPLDQVHVFPFVRRSPTDPSRLRSHVACGPRNPGSWDCRIPVTDLLRHFKNGEGELGLRIEAHGDLRVRTQHSTVIVTVPVYRLTATTAGR